MKTGLVLEGGALRGIYTAGVLDVFIENDICFDGIIGVSAGALFGVNLLSKQKGRVLRYNKRFNSDRNYMGIKPFLKTGNIIDTEYAYDRVPRQLDVFDNETFMKSGVPFYAVVTNIEKGEAEYVLVEDVFEQMDVLRASGSMPFVSRPVEIDGKLYLDGAVTDSIPFERFEEMGYDRLVVVLTKTADYVKSPMSPVLTRMFYGRKYPEFEVKLRERHINYNSCMERLKAREEKGDIILLRPERNTGIKRMERDPQKMQETYDMGVKDASDNLEKIKAFLCG